ncbi:hypothetical protein CRUP_035252 [Coryphaenoides rupestris]|nr:hypothetical protein CRUP_035252 [Coryphaenoides rupestris]
MSSSSSFLSPTLLLSMALANASTSEDTAAGQMRRTVFGCVHGVGRQTKLAHERPQLARRQSTAEHAHRLRKNMTKGGELVAATSPAAGRSRDGGVVQELIDFAAEILVLVRLGLLQVRVVRSFQQKWMRESSDCWTYTWPLRLSGVTVLPFRDILPARNSTRYLLEVPREPDTRLGKRAPDDILSSGGRGHTEPQANAGNPVFAH